MEPATICFTLLVVLLLGLILAVIGQVFNVEGMAFFGGMLYLLISMLLFCYGIFKLICHIFSFDSALIFNFIVGFLFVFIWLFIFRFVCKFISKIISR